MIHYELATLVSTGRSASGYLMRYLFMASRVQSSTTSHRQDLDKLSHVLYVRQLHQSSPQRQYESILTERLIPHGKLY
jgi:hypothetical protein